ncbi:hypothetical protein [Aquiflexum lacus]|uniref:hypothetical protein n=1 Tax=Aquiflexum lacus TaxID=2483805 RepID=UPI001894C311|nr:hypothetical protein [Aquiflexum lacus]
MITYHLNRHIEIFKGFNRFSKFILIGNSSYGYLNVKKVNFDCFEEVIKKLPIIINDLAFNGKWDLTLYQITGQYDLIEKSKNHFIPKKGRRVFKLDDQIATTFMDIFVNFSIIHLALCNKEIKTNIVPGESSYFIELSENYLTIHLEENIHQKSISLKIFNGDQDKLFDSYRY